MSLRIYCKNLVGRLYEKFSTFLRVEVCVNRMKDLGLNNGVENLARPGVPRRPKGQDGDQRDGGLVHQHAPKCNVHKSRQEEQMWFNETLASGMAPYHHMIGGENGMGEDRRWLKTAQEYFNWMARHDIHFATKCSIANVGVVMGQRTHLFYNPPHGARVREYMDGMYYALLEGRFLSDFVHEDKLEQADLAQYSALALPNTALLSDQQCRQLRGYVDAEGSLLATSMYTERNERRSDFGLADVFGIRKTGDIIGTAGNAYLARIEKQHGILNGFSNTAWIPGAENRVPVAPVEGPILTVVPGFVAYPPELSYPPQARMNRRSWCGRKARAA